MTEYLILRQHDIEGGVWKQYATLTSSSPKRALKSISDVMEGTYVAVPKRSWKPFTISVEQTTKVTIG